MQYRFIITSFYFIGYSHGYMKCTKKRNPYLSSFKNPNLQSTYATSRLSDGLRV